MLAIIVGMRNNDGACFSWNAKDVRKRFPWMAQLFSSVDVKDVRKPKAGDSVDTSHSLHDWNMLRVASRDISSKRQQPPLGGEHDGIHVIADDEDMDAWPAFMAVCTSDGVLRGFGYDSASCIPPSLQAVFSAAVRLAAKPYAKALVERLGLDTITGYLAASSSSSFSLLAKDANAFGASPDDNAMFDEWVADMRAGHMLNPRAFMAVRDAMESVFGDDWNSKMDDKTRNALMIGNGRSWDAFKRIPPSGHVMEAIRGMDDERRKWELMRDGLEGNGDLVALERILSGEIGEDVKALFANDIPHAMEFIGMMMQMPCLCIQAAEWSHDLIMEQYGMYAESGYDKDVYEIKCNHAKEVIHSDLKYEFLMAESRMGMHEAMRSLRKRGMFEEHGAYIDSMDLYDSTSCAVMKKILDGIVAAWDETNDGMKKSLERILSCFVDIAFWDYRHDDLFLRAMHAISVGRRNGVGYMDSCMRLDALIEEFDGSLDMAVSALGEWLQSDWKDYPVEFIAERVKSKETGNDADLTAIRVPACLQ